MNLDFTDLTEFLPPHPKQKEAVEKIIAKEQEVEEGIKSLIGFTPTVKPLGTWREIKQQVKAELEAIEQDKSAEKIKYFKVNLQETETFFLIDIPTSYFSPETEEGARIARYIECYKEREKANHPTKPSDGSTQTLTGSALDKNIQTLPVTYRDQSNQATVWDIEDSYNSSNSTKDEVDKEANFLRTTQILQRILASNNFRHKQMLFHSYIMPSRGIGKYTLTLLWSFKDICEFPVLGVCWNPKTQKILAACYGDRDKEGGVLCVWNVKNPHTPERRIKTEANINCLMFAKTRPDILAYACLDGSVSHIDITSYLPEPVDLQKRGHGHWPVWGITWFMHEEIGNVSERLMTCGEMGEIHIWNLENKTFSKMEEIAFTPTPNKYKEHDNVQKEFPFKETLLPSYWITPHPIDRRTYYVGTFTGAIATCKTLSVCGKRELWKAHDGVVLGMKFSPFTHLVFLTYGLDGYLNIWVDGIQEPVHQISHLPYYVIGGEWSPTHSTILFTLTYEELRVWNLTKSDGKYHANIKYERFTCMSISNNGMNIAAGCEDGNILVYKLNDLPHPPCRQVQVLKKALKHYAYYNKDIVKKIYEILKNEEAIKKEKNFDFK